MKMRLDKFMTATATATRTEAAKAAKQGRIKINDIPCKNPATQIDPNVDVIKFDGEVIQYSQFIYVLLNKPKGYIIATEDGREKKVLDLLPEKLQGRGLFPCGRLDKNTTGLMLLTNNGDLGHKLLSPRYHVKKTYRFEAQKQLSIAEKEKLENGVSILDDYITKKAELVLDPDGQNGIITITEGKYHQIKLMFEAVDNKILELERITFGPLTMEKAPPQGSWRYLTDEEIEKLENHCK